MKKIRPAILAMLLLIMVLSVTACGSNNSNTNSSTGASQNSSSAATSTSTAETSAMSTTGAETEGGVIDGLMNDVEKGAHDVKDGMDDITGESGMTNETTHANTTETR